MIVNTQPIVLFFAILAMTTITYADTAEAIASIYAGKKLSTDVQQQLGRSSDGISASGSGKAASTLEMALSEAKLSNKISDIQANYMKKYKSSIGVELKYVNMAIDASVKYGTVKFLYSDLMAISIQRDLLYQEARMMSLQEDFSTQIEKEFK
jgi:hypothetical protein